MIEIALLRVRVRASVVLAFLLLFAAVAAQAGARISEPRHVQPKIDEVDSSRVVMREAGITLGTPAGMNLELGWWPHPIFGVRVSGLYLGPHASGVQGNFCITVRRRYRSRLALAPIVGTFASDGDSWSYGGLALDWNTGPVFLEIGVVGGGGNIPDLENQHVGAVAKFGVMGGGGILGPR